MSLRGNQGTVTFEKGYAYKKYHGNLDISNEEYFLYEVENLKKIKILNGRLNIFQLPTILDYNVKDLVIKMTVIDRNLPYIVDLCPMIRDRDIFDGFIQEIFTNYVCEQHSVSQSDIRVGILRDSLIYLADEFSIYYTDPKATNVSIGI